MLSMMQPSILPFTGTLELLRSGRIAADFWEWRVGAPFKFKNLEDADEGPPTADAAAADDDDAAPNTLVPTANGQETDVVQGMSMGDKRVADAAVRQRPHDHPPLAVGSNLRLRVTPM